MSQEKRAGDRKIFINKNIGNNNLNMICLYQRRVKDNNKYCFYSTYLLGLIEVFFVQITKLNKLNLFLLQCVIEFLLTMTK